MLTDSHTSSIHHLGRKIRSSISKKSAKDYLGSEAVLGSLISRKTIRNQELSLSQNPDPLLSTIRNQVPRPHNLHQVPKFI
jgi:hypothetical protein